MPTAIAEGLDRIPRVASEKVSARRAIGCVQIDTGPRRSPSASSQILKKKNRGSAMTLGVLEDSGWYKPQYDAADRLDWGRGAITV